MSFNNFYFIALRPSLPEELATRAVQTKLLAPKNLESVVKPVYIPLSFQFNTDEDGIFALGNAIQRALNNTNSFLLNLRRLEFNDTYKQISILPEANELLEEIQIAVINVLLDWNNFEHSPVSFEFPKNHVALARGGWSSADFEIAKVQALTFELDLKWTIETVSMMQWTDSGWNEKFFFPLEDQRLLRNRSNSILQDK